jgi:hypothetical protein
MLNGVSPLPSLSLFAEIYGSRQERNFPIQQSPGHSQSENFSFSHRRKLSFAVRSDPISMELKWFAL